MKEAHELRPIAAERLPLLNKLTAGIQQHGMLATPSLHWWLGLMLLGALGLPPGACHRGTGDALASHSPGTLCRPAGSRLALHVPPRSLVDCNLPYC